MAKALLGHVSSGPDARLAAEVTRLRARIAELEAEVAQLRPLAMALEPGPGADLLVLPNTIPEAVAEAEPAYT
jgi:hypothetical protein